MAWGFGICWATRPRRRGPSPGHQRREEGRGLDAAVTLGLGAARPDGWVAWFLFGLGLRVDLGPLFLAGELAFEQRDQLRLMAGLGARF